MKRFCLLFLVFVMLFSSMALGDEVEQDSNIDNVMVLDMKGDPRFTYLGSIAIGLDIDENGCIEYSGSARTSGYNLRISLYLRRSGNGFLWDDLECYVSTGYNYVITGGSRTVPEGDYFYRAKIIVEVLDSNRNVIETATGYSSHERY